MQKLFIPSANPCTIFILIKKALMNITLYIISRIETDLINIQTNRHMKNIDEMHVIIIFLDRSNNSISKHIIYDTSREDTYYIGA